MNIFNTSLICLLILQIQEIFVFNDSVTYFINVARYFKFSVHWNSPQQTIYTPTKLRNILRQKTFQISRLYYSITDPTSGRLKNTVGRFTNIVNLDVVSLRHALALWNLLCSEGTIEKNPGPARKLNIGRKSRDAKKQKKYRNSASVGDEVNDDSNEAIASVPSWRNHPSIEVTTEMANCQPGSSGLEHDVTSTAASALARDFSGSPHLNISTPPSITTRTSDNNFSGQDLFDKNKDTDLFIQTITTEDMDQFLDPHSITASGVYLNQETNIPQKRQIHETDTTRNLLSLKRRRIQSVEMEGYNDRGVYLNLEPNIPRKRQFRETESIRNLPALKKRRIENLEIERSACEETSVSNHVFDPLSLHIAHPSLLTIEKYKHLFEKLTFGSIFDGPRCHFCKAFRFRNEHEGFCCSKGKVVLQSLPAIPDEIRECYTDRHFLKNIRKYNNALALASMGCEEIRMPGYSPTVKICGKVHHYIGSLVPNASKSPLYAQLYFYDTNQEFDNRKRLHSSIRPPLLRRLQDCLHSVNPFVKQIKSALDISDTTSELKIVVQKSGPDKTYDAPTSSHVAAITGFNDASYSEVVFQKHSGELRRINEMNRIYDALHYVLLLPRGSEGYHPGMKKNNGKANLTVQDYYLFRLQIRSKDPLDNILLSCHRLSQQFVVDMFAKIESFRLRWIRDNQQTFRVEKYKGLVDALDDNDTNDQEAVGKRIILPASFVASPRWYAQRFQDCMGIVRKYGRPDLFLTMTCNPKWEEITSSMFSMDKDGDRPDLCVRVFNGKLQILLQLLSNESVLGQVIAYTCMKEDQKRGLPHAHILLILAPDHKIREPHQVDMLISAEIPDKHSLPQLFKCVTEQLVHGPCGDFNPDASCMKADGESLICGRSYPKKFNNDATTISAKNHYPIYLRRDPDHGGNTAEIYVKGILTKIDNSWIVPFNPFLTQALNCHINVETVVSIIGSVKYVYKYICKGSDKILFSVESIDMTVVDEPSLHQCGRYITATDAYWRMYKYKICQAKPNVVRLPIHLPSEQSVVFDMEHADEAVAEGEPQTELLGFFDLNSRDPDAQNILYPDICRHYRWHNKKWVKRQRKTGSINADSKSDAVGRLPIISLNPKQEELYYLRMLLYHVAGAKSFNDLKMVNGIVHESFKAACLALGLLADDNEIDDAMNTAATVEFGSALRQLFATLLAFGNPIDPVAFWNRHKITLCLDFTKRLGYFEEPTPADFNRALNEIQSVLSSLHLDLSAHFGINYEQSDPEVETVIPDITTVSINQDITEDMLNVEQKNAFSAIVSAIEDRRGACFSLDAPGGAGKTFLISTIMSHLLNKGKTIIATATSGIAATLMLHGRTLHSTFKVPLEVDESSSCNISPRDPAAEKIRQCSLLIIDEVTMAHKFIYEALDRTLKDILDGSKLFGGLTVLLSGDWRQILPVVYRGGRAEIVNACLKFSKIWQQVEPLRLFRNMRLTDDNQDNSAYQEFLLAVGEGRIGTKCNGGYDVPIPKNLILDNKTKDGLCDFVFGSDVNKWCDKEWISRRGILSPLNETANEINRMMRNKQSGVSAKFLSADIVSEEDQIAQQYPTEYLNTLECSGIAPHCLELKIGCPVMLLRNLDPSRGHVNGSRYVITRMFPHLIEVEKTCGAGKGSKKLIPRIWMTPSDPSLPFTMKRKQFPIQLCYALTINKSQGQSFSRVGVYLSRNCFAHGQLYVALSRVKDSKNIKVLPNSPDDDTMRNIVYHEVL